MAETIPNIAVVIPSYRVRDSILSVIERIPPMVQAIFVVDDACPEGTGSYVRDNCSDPRVHVLQHEENRGVGGAVVTGYRAALQCGAEISVKVDGDGQMDPGEIPAMVAPIVSKQADYTKGNRFFSPAFVRQMPPVRLIGNSVLSFVSKASSGYWNIMDPTNGFTAIHSTALKNLPLDRLAARYFFESDILFRLYTIRAVVKEVPLPARYGNENSGLRVMNAAMTFPGRYLTCLVKRILYSYFVRDFNLCSLQLMFGVLMSGFGFTFGAWHWWQSIATGVPATAGTVLVAALPFMLGFQLLLSALLFDVNNVPREPLQVNYR